MALFSDLQEALRAFAEGGPAELRSNGSRIAPLSTLCWEVRGSTEKPLLHLWSENHNLTRRVLAITDHSAQRLALAVECFGRSKPDRLEFLRTEFERSAADLGRDAFARSVQSLCEKEFADDTLESLTSAADLEHSLSANYVRGVLRRGREAWALFVAPTPRDALDAPRCMTFALLWLGRVQKAASNRSVLGLRVIVPKDCAAPIAHLIPVLRTDLRVQIFERDDVLESLQRVEPSETTNFVSWIVPLRHTQSLLERAKLQLDPLRPASSPAISFHANVASGEVVVRFRGISCMRWHESGIFYGPKSELRKLSPEREKDLRKMFRELEIYRQPLASDTKQPLYRAQPERWLEFLVREDVSRVDAALDPNFAYSQVLATSGNEHGVLDVLTVTRSGRLAILELKTSEDPVFLLQAAGYWLRIKKHLEQEDFPRYGYFSGITLQNAAPLVYLIAPALRFHPATGSLLRYLNPQIEVVRVGLAENWRRGLSVILRQ